MLQVGQSKHLNVSRDLGLRPSLAIVADFAAADLKCSDESEYLSCDWLIIDIVAYGTIF